ncbi:polymeric immunoglobulin receptor-like [Channa argus]|uniref:polymeric immunoglobulin receptor-like n=1 Tax=Channa argus TaxID=215402 RepID=UPI002944D9B8|nr:hypothetical protein Q8A73_014501 [Channa argus]
MNIQRVLLFCFLSAPWGGNTGLVSAKLNIYTGAEGGNGSINCHLPLSGSWKFFCKDECDKDGILVKTDGVRANSGRYSIKYQTGSSGRGILSVTITNMIRSDSGLYTCGLGESSGPDSYTSFMVRVSNEVLNRDVFMTTDVEGETIKKPCHREANQSRIFFCKGDCKTEEDVLIETDEKKAQSGRYGIEYIEESIFGLYVTIKQVKKSDTGQYKCGYGRALSPDSPFTFSLIVIDDPSTSKPTPSLSPFSTSVPTTATVTTPQGLIGSTSGSSAPSPVSTDITEQSTAAVVTTSKPTQTLQPFSASAAQGLTSSTAPSVFSDTTDQFTVLSYIPHPGYVLPLVGCVSLVGVLLLVLLLVYKWKTVKNSRSFEFPVIYSHLV